MPLPRLHLPLIPRSIPHRLVLCPFVIGSIPLIAFGEAGVVATRPFVAGCSLVVGWSTVVEAVFVAAAIALGSLVYMELIHSYNRLVLAIDFVVVGRNCSLGIVKISKVLELHPLEFFLQSLVAFWISYH